MRKKVVIWVVSVFALALAGVLALAHTLETYAESGMCRDQPGTKWNNRTSSCDAIEP